MVLWVVARAQVVSTIEYTCTRCQYGHSYNTHRLMTDHIDQVNAAYYDVAKDKKEQPLEVERTGVE